MTRDQADSLLDDFLYWYQLEGNRYREDYIAAKKAVLDAMTLPAETIAEQQREIARLRKSLDTYGRHTMACSMMDHYEHSTDCTCGFRAALRRWEV